MWWVKSLPSVVPGVVAGAAGFLSTGSASVAALASSVVTALALPVVDRWFKRQEILAEAEWGNATESENAQRAAMSASGTGALRRALATIIVALSDIEEAATDAVEGHQILERGCAELSGVIGGGDRIPRLLQRAYKYNSRSCELLDKAGSELDEAATQLNIVCGVIR